MSFISKTRTVEFVSGIVGEDVMKSCQSCSFRKINEEKGHLILQVYDDKLGVRTIKFVFDKDSASFVDSSHNVNMDISYAWNAFVISESLAEYEKNKQETDNNAEDNSELGDDNI